MLIDLILKEISFGILDMLLVYMFFIYKLFFLYLLLQGNIKFKEEEDKIEIMEKDVLENVSKLLSVDIKELQTALSERVIAARGEVMQKNLTLSEGKFVADALAKVQ